MIKAFPIKPVDPKIALHPLEQRGFVTVPFDYANPEADTLQIFYRLIPAYASSVDDRSKPIIVVINGGPGVASSAYRALNFDYEHADAPQNGPVNRFRYLLNSYQVLIVDQRGTDGHSAPIDMECEQINANGIAHYFSSDNQARDYLAVIEEVVPKDENFFIVAQSYGGMVGMQYLALDHARKPKGIVFSCSALPYEDIRDAMMSRRAEQLKLNKQLKAAIPDIEKKLAELRSHLRLIGIDPCYAHSLYSLLGKGNEGEWQSTFVKQLDKMLMQDKQQTQKEIKDNLGAESLLNYILSSANFTPGYTDRTLAKITSEAIPFEAWMLDENCILMQTGADLDWKNIFVEGMDSNPPPATPFPSVDELRAQIANNQLLFVAGENDAFVPAEAYLRAVEKFRVPGHTEIMHLPGGHNAIFLEKGYEAFKRWAAKL